MAPSPTIPTSFVPKQPVKSTARFAKTGGNTFLMFSVFVLTLSLIGTGAAFGYTKYLEGIVQERKSALELAEKKVNTDEVDSYVRSRERFGAASGILDNHVALSNFFDLLERVTLVNVRFDSFSFSQLSDGSAEISLAGSAKSFNALAAQSAAFSSEKNLRGAIFSGIELDDKGAVSFDVDAQLTKEILTFTVGATETQTMEPMNSNEPSVQTETAPAETQPEPEGTGIPPQL